MVRISGVGILLFCREVTISNPCPACSLPQLRLRRAADDLMYGTQLEWDTWGSGHMASMEEEIKSLEEFLPTGRKLSEDHKNIIKAKLPARLEKVRGTMLCSPPNPNH